MDVNQAYYYLFLTSLIIIGLCLIAVIIRSIIGPKMTDRIVTINMIGTLVVSVIAILSIYLKNAYYIIDVCIIYVLISVVSVVVLSNMFINRYLEKKKDLEHKKEEAEKNGMD